LTTEGCLRSLCGSPSRTSWRVTIDWRISLVFAHVMKRREQPAAFGSTFTFQWESRSIENQADGPNFSWSASWRQLEVPKWGTLARRSGWAAGSVGVSPVAGRHDEGHPAVAGRGQVRQGRCGRVARDVCLYRGRRFRGLCGRWRTPGTGPGPAWTG
jgi:hypothetical protein